MSIVSCGQPSRLARICNGKPAETARIRVLVERVRGGDPDAFAGIYVAYRPMVHAYLASRVAAQDVDDLVSETFTRALAGLLRGQFTWQGRDLGAWLVTIARHRLASSYRAAYRRREVASGDVCLERADSTTPESEALDRENGQAVAEAMSQLAADHRKVVQLRILDGHSPADAARLMGRSAGAVKDLQRRALTALADALPAGVAA